MSDLEAEYQNYSLNLGHLINTFGRMESLLTSALKLHLAMNIGSPTDTRAMQLASAIYGSMRLRAARDTVKRVLDADDAPTARRARVEKVFEQLGHIESLRDKLAHQIVTPAHSDLGAYWQVSDHVTTRKLKQIKVWVFDTAAISHAAADLDKAAHFLGAMPISDRLFSHLDEAALPNWKYNASMLREVPHSKLRVPPHMEGGSAEVLWDQNK